MAVLAACVLFTGEQARSEEYIIEIKRKLTSIDEYQECQNWTYSGEECNAIMNDWLKSHPEDWGRGAELVRKNQNAYVAMPYYATAVEKGQVQCSDSGLAQATTAALGLPADNTVQIAAAKKVAMGQCFEALREPIKAELTNSYVFENICKEMSAKKALSSLQEKKCNAG